MLGFAQDLGRQTPIAGVHHVARQPAGDVGTRSMAQAAAAAPA